MKHPEEDEITEPGWYWYDSEYPEEGSWGPYDSEPLARVAALDTYDSDDMKYIVFWRKD